MYEGMPKILGVTWRIGNVPFREIIARPVGFA